MSVNVFALPVHPAADLFPMLSSEELSDLAADIAANGMHEPLWVYDDPERGRVLLDGRNRRAACELASILEPTWRRYEGTDPIGFALSLNVSRRHLNVGQRAAIAYKVLPLYEAEAKTRQLATLAQNTVMADPPQRDPATSARLARDQAAAAVGASGRRVGQYKRVATNAPDLAKQVDAGTLALDAAEKQLTRRNAQQAEQKARETTLAAVTIDASGDRWRLLAGDYRERLMELPAGCVDLIVTDPPYPADSLPLYRDLGRVARHLLADDGICVVLTGQMHLPVVIANLSEHLTYGWMYVQPLPGANSRIMGRHVLQSFKPWIAFTKGTWPSGRIDWHPDMLDPSYRAKDTYRWQQDPNPAKLLIDSLCPPTGSVCDPYAGTGAYGVAALQMGRSFIGAELDAGRFTSASERLKAVT